MGNDILSCLQGDLSVKEVYKAWRNSYRDDTDDGTLEILQMVVNLTGYGYVLKKSDLKKIDDMGAFVRDHIVKSNYQETVYFSMPTFCKHSFQLFQLMIAHDRQELLQNNIWLNRLSRLLVGFCEVDNDECKIVGGYMSTIILVNLSVVREQVEKELDKLQQGEDDSEEIEVALRRDRYIRKMSMLLVRNIEAGSGFAATLPTIAELLCRMIEVYPTTYILEDSVLHLLAILLQHRHSKVFRTVANCLKCLLNHDTQSPEVVETVAKFFVDSMGKKFIQAMLTYKSSEKLAMEVIVSVQRRNCGESIFDKDVTEKIRQQLFHGDDIVRGYAIDFLAYTLYRPDVQERTNNKEILLHILKLYERYEHSSSALSLLVEDLWLLNFFDDWQTLFDLLNEETKCADNLFMIMAIVHIINQCYALLMRDLNPDNRAKSTNTDYCHLRGLLKSFMHHYPCALRNCASHDHVFIVLLQSAHAKHHAGLQKCNVKVDRYYEQVFVILETMAQEKSEFYVIQKCLMVIRSYSNLILDVDQIWSELLIKYTEDFNDTRTMITSRNIGKDIELMNKYVQCLTRLVAYLELDYSLDRQLSNLPKILFNDFRLLDRMKLNREQESIFCRLYKCIIYTLIKDLQEKKEANSLQSSFLHQYTGRRLKGRVMELLCLLIKQLRKFDEPLDSCVHTFISLCDILVMTQTAIVNSDITELRDIGYQVEPAVLELMAKYLLNCLFSKDYDWRETPVMKQRAMFAKYIDLYSMHMSLPRITDTYYIVANYSIDSQFERQMEQLMMILHQTDPNQFDEIISRAAFQLLLVYKSESSVKNFIKKIQTFITNKMTESAKCLAGVFGKILERLMDIVLDTENSMAPIRMLKLIEPLALHIQKDERSTTGKSMLQHSNYAELSESDRKLVNRFVKHLKK